MNQKWKRDLLERFHQESAAMRDDFVVMFACRLAAAEMLLAKATGLSPIIVRDLIDDNGHRIEDFLSDPPAAESAAGATGKGGASCR